MLAALGEDGAEGPPRPRRSREAGDLLEDLGEEMRRAFKAAQASDVGRVVRQEVDKAVQTVQSMDVGRMVTEAVEQVKDAVTNAVESGGRETVAEKKEWSLESAGIGALDASTQNGNVRFAAAEDDHVRIVAHKRVKGRDHHEVEAFAQQVLVRILHEGETVQVFVEHPKLPRGLSLEVDFEIAAPAGVDLKLRTVNGNVVAKGSQGAVTAQSTNGNIDVEGGDGQISMRTQNGSITADAIRVLHEAVFSNTNGSIDARLAAGCAPVTATSTNGSVAMRLPADFDGRLDARTTNGSVSSDFELSDVELSKRTQLVGVLGEGGPAQVRLQTLNGNVELKATAVEPAPAA